MSTKVAFDIGGVIVNKTSREPYPEALISIKLYVEKLKPENVYILSKAKDKWIKANIELFERLDFYNVTGVTKDNVIFVDEYVDKRKKCEQLDITYMIDDSVKVIRFMQDINTTPIWFGEHNVPTTEKLEYVNVPKWKHLRKLLNKI